MIENYPARVFLSCGQREGTEEYKIAKNIVNKLEKLGFDTYFAGRETDLKDVKGNTFLKLIEADYFIFVDFKRERLFVESNGKFGDTKKHRGSLFSHQELAIATLSDKEFLLFHEKGVKERDGISMFTQSKSKPFSDRKKLPNQVITEVKRKGWRSDWRNELLLVRYERDFEDNVHAIGIYRDGVARFYHIKVRNLHRQKVAYGCLAYVEKIVDRSNGEEKSFETVEFKWKGIKTREAAILPKDFRYLDAFHVYYDSQDVVNLGINRHLIDFSGYEPPYILTGPGTFEITFAVYSNNFSPARSVFTLVIGRKMEDIKFYNVMNNR